MSQSAVETSRFSLWLNFPVTQTFKKKKKMGGREPLQPLLEPMTSSTKPPRREEVNKKPQVDRRIKWRITLILLPLDSAPTPLPPSQLAIPELGCTCAGEIRPSEGPSLFHPRLHCLSFQQMRTEAGVDHNCKMHKIDLSTDAGKHSKCNCFLKWEILLFYCDSINDCE